MNPMLSSEAPRIVVLGSLNMDLVVRVPHAPAAGETLQGHSIHSIPGGKGGNQAVSCARQGAQVSLLGCVGADAHGEALRQALQQDGIDTTAVQIDPAAPTGTALVMVEDSGQNRIVVIAGANARVEIDDAALAARLDRAAFLVAQFESPLVQVARAMNAAVRAGCKVLLNPSPVQAVDAALWPLIDTLVVNEVEARTLAGQPAEEPRDAAAAGAVLRARGVARVVVTLGAGGAVAIDADGARHHPAPRVQAVDTTAAGDTFLGALAVTLACGGSLDEAVRLGIRAAALCITQPGAQPSIPLRDAVLRSPLPPDWTPL
ncbi:ribokinase [Variovorax sp. J22G21]|uniref:ribokinase n=2 Tax=Variovorax fucosicus TaxID=3053517 RepID=UPI0025787936|nr:MULTISPECIES: ribokinase [unclassified Variovorax]MDM0042549.1 ribokinase [Variovorax sp. J22R193]MDM0061154.1 ribokinase [Variovorax sp. J22G21]